MARFNAAGYDPAQDSSKGHSKHREDGFQGVVLVVPEGTCPDGCGQKPNGKKRVFRQGHDARLKGILIRAGATSNKVRLVEDNKTSDLTPEAYAGRFGFSPQVKAGIEREAARATIREQKLKDRVAKASAKKSTAKKATTAKATTSGGPQKGDRFPVKVGRWTYEGEIVKISKGVATLVYSAKNGDEYEVERPLADLKA